jgi:PAS domain S-box-containing protein
MKCSKKVGNMPESWVTDIAVEASGFLELAPVGLLIASQAGVVIWANAAAGVLLGQSTTHLVGRRVTDLLPIEELDDIAAPARATSKALAVPKADGTLTYVEARASERRDSEGADRFIVALHEVTNWKVPEERLKNTLERMEFTLIGAKTGVFEIDLVTGWSTVSQSWMRMMGIPDDLQIDTQREWRARMHPDDLPAVLAADKDCIVGKIPQSTTIFRMLDADGKNWRWMRSEAVVSSRDAAGRAVRFIGAQTDITDQKEAEEALWRTSEEFRSAFDNAPIGKAIVGLDGRWLRVNPALCKLMGYSKEHLLQTDFQTLTHPDDLEKDLDQVRKLIAGEGSTYRMEKRYFRADEAVILADLSVGIVRDDAGAPLHFISQIVDVTEQRGLEHMKSQFVANVSHELRTPLTSILGALGLLAAMPQEAFPDEVNRLIYIAAQNAERLRMRVSDILDFEGLTTGKLRLSLAQERIVPLVEKSVLNSMVYAERHGVTIAMEPMDRSVSGVVDADRFEQVMTNLLSNAAKFATKGTAIRVGMAASDELISVHVSNDGPTIPDRYQAALFRPFSHITKSEEQRREGTGLGLSICKEIVEQMGGRIGYESADGTTTFWFTLRPVS